MKMGYMLNRHMPQVIDIETQNHWMTDPDFDVDYIDSYAWTEDDFFRHCSFKDEDGLVKCCAWAAFDDEDEDKLMGFVVYRLNKRDKKFDIIKLEADNNYNTKEILSFILSWLKSKCMMDGCSLKRVECVVEETALDKVGAFQYNDFDSSLRLNAFAENENDGIFFKWEQS